ncbi:hypothetical protein ABZ769_22270 [Streptomyces olivoreticuli]
MIPDRGAPPGRAVSYSAALGWPVFEGRPELTGPTYAWAAETGAHALRLITSGLFDRFPTAKVVLGHMGELLPFHLSRLDTRLPFVQSEVKLADSPLGAPGTYRRGTRDKGAQLGAARTGFPMADSAPPV